MKKCKSAQHGNKFFQLLAALLITRQVVGNLKESLLPYATKHLKVTIFTFRTFSYRLKFNPNTHSLDG